MYQDEPGLASEVIQEERSEVNLNRIEDEMEEVQADSEDEAPVFLDLSGFRAGKDTEVCVTKPCKLCNVTGSDVIGLGLCASTACNVGPSIMAHNCSTTKMATSAGWFLKSG